MPGRLFLCVLFASSLGGCSSTPQRFEERHENGRLRREGTLRNGKQVGRWTHYYADGTKKAEGTFEDDLQEGSWTYWYEDGRKEMEGAFDGGRRSGDWTYWHRNGSLRAQGRFEGDLETGLWTFWEPTGVKERSGHFEAGKLAHHWTYFDGSGTPIAEGCYLNGSKVGTWKLRDREGRVTEKSAPVPPGHRLIEERSAGGVLRRQGFLCEGKQHGRWVTWHSNGAMRMLGDFQEGEAVGMWEAFHAGGTRFAIGPVSRGKLAGAWTVWRDGKESALRPDELHAPPLVRGDWSSDSLSSERSPEQVLALWLAEASAPADEAASGYAFAGTALEDRSGIEPGAPTTGAQVELTVEQQERLSRIVQSYDRGGKGAAEYREPSHLPAFAIHGGAPDYVHREAGQFAHGEDEELARSLLGKGLPDSRLRDTEGAALDVEAYRGKKNVLLVILRGFDGRVCEYCAGQTMALGRNRQEFEARDTEVLVVYPGRESRLEAFLEAYKLQFKSQPPRFQFLYDSELDLANALGIGPPEGKVARPTVLLLDKSGKVVFAHVGTRREDRPTVERILEEIDRLAAGGGSGSR